MRVEGAESALHCVQVLLTVGSLVVDILKHIAEVLRKTLAVGSCHLATPRPQI